MSSIFSTFRTRPRSFASIPRQYRDGMTYAEEMQAIVEELSRYETLINSTLQGIPETIKDAIDGQKGEELERLASVEEMVATIREETQRSLTSMASKVEDAVNTVINSEIEVSDQVLYGVLSDPESSSHQLVKSWL